MATDTKEIKKIGDRYEITMNDDSQFVVTGTHPTHVFTTMADAPYTPTTAQSDAADAICLSLCVIKY